MNSGNRPGTLKLGLLPGLLPGVAVALAAILVVGGASVATSALGGSSSSSPTATHRPTAGVATSTCAPLAAVSPAAQSEAGSVNPSASASASASPAPSTPAGALTTQWSARISFSFDSSSTRWTSQAASAAGWSYEPSYDSGFGEGGSGGSLEVTASGGNTSGQASGSWVWTGPWSDLGVTTANKVVAMSGSFDVYVDSIGGNCSISVGLELADSNGATAGELVPPSRQATERTWSNLAGAVVAVPAALQPRSSLVTLKLSGGSDDPGTATWHLDGVRLTVYCDSRCGGGAPGSSAKG